MSTGEQGVGREGNTGRQDQKKKTGTGWPCSKKGRHGRMRLPAEELNCYAEETGSRGR